MLNITQNKLQHAIAVDRQNLIFEQYFETRLRPILGRQWRDIADKVKNGIIWDWEFILDRQYTRLVNLYDKVFRKVASYYFKDMNESIEKERSKSNSRYERKDTDYYFWTPFFAWLGNAIRSKPQIINNTTKNIIKKVIQKAFDQGLSYEETAKKLIRIGDVSNKVRAKRIARTEIHTLQNKIYLDTIKASRVNVEKEWMYVFDERTREWHRIDQTIGINDWFVVANELMQYPGDMTYASPFNYINCRCQALYHTIEYM